MKPTFNGHTENNYNFNPLLFDLIDTNQSPTRLSEVGQKRRFDALPAACAKSASTVVLDDGTITPTRRHPGRSPLMRGSIRAIEFYLPANYPRTVQPQGYRK